MAAGGPQNNVDMSSSDDDSDDEVDYAAIVHSLISRYTTYGNRGRILTRGDLLSDIVLAAPFTSSTDLFLILISKKTSTLLICQKLSIDRIRLI